MLSTVIQSRQAKNSLLSFRAVRRRIDIILITTMIIFIFFFSLSFFQQKLFAQSDDIYEKSDTFGFDYKQEKEDETFFYFGRFFMLGGEVGVRTFTGSLGTIYEPGVEIGTYATYFLTLGGALELMVDYSWHNFVVDNTAGTVSLLNVNLNGKYYITSSEFNRALAYANPYIFGGFGQYIRFSNSPAFPSGTTDNAWGLDFGAGFEFPLSERKLYMGLKGVFHWIFFKDENQLSNNGTRLDGDAVSFLLTINYNF